MNTVFRSLLKSTCGLNRPRYKGATSLCRRTQYSDSLDYSPDSSYGSEKIDDHKRGDENDFSSRQVGQSREGPRYRTSFAEYVKNYGYADFRSVAYVQKMRSVGDKQPVWRSKGLINGKIEDIDSGSLLGRWVVMFFYPLNCKYIYTFVHLQTVIFLILLIFSHFCVSHGDP